MTVIVNEQDIDFCVDAIKLIKENNATFVKKDTSTINDKCIDIYKNMDDEVVIKIKEIDLIKADRPQQSERTTEWNFVKDGKFPAENTECLCIIRPVKDDSEPFGCKDFRAVLFYRNKKFYLEEIPDDDRSLIYADSDFSKLVVAWKEIILPKEKDY